MLCKFLVRLNDQLTLKAIVSYERIKIRYKNSKGDNKRWFFIKLIVVLLSQFFLGLVVIVFYFKVLKSSGLNDEILYAALKKVGAREFLYIAIGVSVVSLVDGVNKVALAVLVILAALLIASIQIVSWVPEDLVFDEQATSIRRTVGFFLLTTMICMIWIPFNAAVVLVTRIANLNPSKKNGSAQPSPAPSDLAHDLRYSRSRARRSQEQR